MGKSLTNSDVVTAKALTLNAKTWTFEAKAKTVGPETKVFKHTIRAAQYTSDSIGNELHFDCFWLGVHLLLITYKLLIYYHYNY